VLWKVGSEKKLRSPESDLETFVSRARSSDPFLDCRLSYGSKQGSTEITLGEKGGIVPDASQGEPGTIWDNTISMIRNT